MKKILIICIAMSCLVATSCKNKKKEREVTVTTENPVGYTVHDVIKGSVTNSHGKTLHYTFDNDNNEATFVYNGETIKMELDTTMVSGSHYKNNHYDYSEWHDQIELKKDGKIIFEYTDSPVKDITLTDANGQKMIVSFDGDIANVKFDGEDIQLKRDVMASGIKYSNSTYEYTEHQGNGELKKNGQTVFKYKI